MLEISHESERSSHTDFENRFNGCSNVKHSSHSGQLNHVLLVTAVNPHYQLELVAKSVWENLSPSRETLDRVYFYRNDWILVIVITIVHTIIYCCKWTFLEIV